jgi:hypothetical protein
MSNLILFPKIKCNIFKLYVFTKAMVYFKVHFFNLNIILIYLHLLL